MPAVPSSPRVKLRSTSRRVPRTRPSEAAVAPETDSEPTMRLSRALLVMLLLHIVAVGGFIASSRIREHDLKRADPAAAVEADDSLSTLKTSDAPHPGPDAKSPESGTPADSTTSALRLIEDRLPSPGKVSVPPPGSALKAPKTLPDSGNLYVVNKGESLYTIAQKFKVSPESLMKLNQIDDPKKLRPGQRLRVPAAAKAKGK